MVIAVAGKGGVGKSTLAALIVRHLVRKRETPVLAVDADPNSTLGEMLRMKVDSTIGDIREGAQSDKYEAPAGVPKQRAIEYNIGQAVIEGSGFDLLVMGRGEGPGCYCSINNMLRTFMHDLAKGYRHVVIDNEAGMEHLSRRTSERVDLMLVVCSPTPVGLLTGRRVAELTREMDIVKGRMGLVINRVTRPISEDEAASATGLELLGSIPEDPLVSEYEMSGRSLIELPEDSEAVTAISGIFEQVKVR